MSLFKAPSATANPQDQRRAFVDAAQSRAADDDESESVAALVSRINLLVRRNLDYAFVHGEVRSFRAWQGTHWYFDLCDQDSKIRCKMYSSQFARLRFDVDDGLLLQARGRVEVNIRKGEIVLVVDHLERAGIGRTLEQLELIKAKFRDEGLLDAARKRPLPLLPRKIGLVTSREGAVIHDMLRVIRERHPRADILLSPTRVQGRGASADIARALRSLDARHDCDVIILARGGGAREDLYSFDMENVARAIIACSVPLVAGIGHESDVTLAELVADLRAATPTYAAQAAVPDVAALDRALRSHSTRMASLVRSVRDRNAHHLAMLVRSFPTKDELLDPFAHDIESLRDRLYAAQARRLRQHRTSTTHLERRLVARSPRKRLAHDRQRLADSNRSLARLAPSTPLAKARSAVSSLASRLDRALLSQTRSAQERLALAVSGLDAMSPLKVLTRGYSLVEHDGRLLTHAAKASAKDKVRIRLQDGSLNATIDSVDVPYS